MKQIFLALALMASVFTAFHAHAQETEAQNMQQSSPTMPTTGDLYNGLTRPLTFSRMIPPYALEVTFNKTVHIIFPSAIRYVDLGSLDLLAGKADGAENVLRVKAATQGFKKECNLSVITDDGSYYTFNVKYADEPVKLSIEMADFLHSGSAVNKPGNELPVYFSDLGSESPYLVRLIMETIYRSNQNKIKDIGSKNFGVQFLLKGIYSHNELIFFHFLIKNSSTVSFNIDYLTFKIVDKKIAKRTAMQEQVIVPLRSYNQVATIGGGREERMVFALPKFTLPDDKLLIVNLTEKDGGRNQSLAVGNADLVHAGVIDNLTIKVK
jgi:conjugative transposon TraN protein